MKRFAKGIAILSVVFSMTLLTGCKGKESSQVPGGETAGAEKQENPVTANKTGIFELEGKMSNINTIANTFVLETKEGNVEIYVRVMSRIMVDGERKPLAALKSGSYAKGTFKKSDGRDTVVEIVITPEG